MSNSRNRVGSLPLAARKRDRPPSNDRLHNPLALDKASKLSPRGGASPDESPQQSPRSSIAAATAAATAAGSDGRDRSRSAGASVAAPLALHPRSHKPHPLLPPIAPGTDMTPKHCNCKNSKCLKLYCECFRNRQYCDPLTCGCVGCRNIPEHEGVLTRAITSTLERNPVAFRPKIASGGAGGAGTKHTRGCNCKKSGCLKKYCECFQAGVLCGANCRCSTCKNFEGSAERLNVVRNGGTKSSSRSGGGGGGGGGARGGSVGGVGVAPPKPAILPGGVAVSATSPFRPQHEQHIAPAPLFSFPLPPGGVIMRPNPHYNPNFVPAFRTDGQVDSFLDNSDNMARQLLASSGRIQAPMFSMRDSGGSGGGGGSANNSPRGISNQGARTSSPRNHSPNINSGNNSPRGSPVDGRSTHMNPAAATLRDPSGDTLTRPRHASCPIAPMPTHAFGDASSGPNSPNPFNLTYANQERHVLEELSLFMKKTVSLTTTPGDGSQSERSTLRLAPLTLSPRGQQPFGTGFHEPSVFAQGLSPRGPLVPVHASSAATTSLSSPNIITTSSTTTTSSSSSSSLTNNSRARSASPVNAPTVFGRAPSGTGGAVAGVGGGGAGAGAGAGGGGGSGTANSQSGDVIMSG